MQNSSKDNNQQAITKSIQCKICGAPARYLYYGVISCQSCKVFFRRNAENKKKTLKCDLNGHCEVTVNNRHVCPYCRLAKCFISGMLIERIRSSRSKQPNPSIRRKPTAIARQTTSTALVRSTTSEKLPTLNILQSDISTLTVDQWNLISNLSHCYDEYSGISVAEQFMHEQNILPHKLRFKNSSVMGFIKTTYDGIPSLYRSNQDFLSLSADDRSILLHSTIKHTGSFSSTTVCQQVHLLGHPAFYHAVGLITNASIIPSIMHIERLLDFDMIIKKLVLAILAFSTTNYTIYTGHPAANLSDLKQILCIQDRYIELIWRYLLYKYDHKQAVICFSNLTRCLFAVHDTVARACDVQCFTDKIDSLAQETEQTLTIND